MINNFGTSAKILTSHLEKKNPTNYCFSVNKENLQYEAWYSLSEYQANINWLIGSKPIKCKKHFYFIILICLHIKSRLNNFKKFHIMYQTSKTCQIFQSLCVILHHFLTSGIIWSSKKIYKKALNRRQSFSLTIYFLLKPTLFGLKRQKSTLLIKLFLFIKLKCATHLGDHYGGLGTVWKYCSGTFACIRLIRTPCTVSHYLFVSITQSFLSSPCNFLRIFLFLSCIFQDCASLIGMPGFFL